MPNLTRREFLGLLGIGAAAAAVGVVGAPQVGGVDKAATGGYLLPEPYADRIVEALKNGARVARRPIYVYAGIHQGLNGAGNV